MTIGDFIKCMRESEGMSQERFAALTTRTQAFISQIERGVVCPSDEFLVELVNATGNQFLRAYLAYSEFETLVRMVISNPDDRGDMKVA